ncbi:uncharacterized protein CIMG_08055 [Coccidioides immitis RS]|uniref:Uncharacterized protein n=1 Tax=Coccidioides immitis (strain RS) TaxID=246410 RepID=J3K4Q3_COCIM|nr:uncharacterized protein CIMG_08055 [Coccidioides immitis RS]EAS29309.3 hypothetical protein CIMG_08055 [Coccidioides immitis RS]
MGSSHQPKQTILAPGSQAGGRKSIFGVASVQSPVQPCQTYDVVETRITKTAFNGNQRRISTRLDASILLDFLWLRIRDNLPNPETWGSAEKVTVSQHYSESALLQHVRAVGKPVTGEWANAVLSSIPEAKSALPEQSPVNR